MSLHLTEEQEAAIRRHLERFYPEEACGFLLGRASGSTRSVQRVETASNLKEAERDRRYLIDPKEFIRVDRMARKDGLDIVGIYHSHPDHPAKPSEFDRAHAWVGYSYVVVSVEKGKSAEMTSWVLDSEGGKFVREEIRKEAKRGK